MKLNLCSYHRGFGLTGAAEVIAEIEFIFKLNPHTLKDRKVREVRR